MSDFKPGDVVYLKSGSPKMTVETVEDEGCKVLWFDKNQETKAAFYSKEVLTKDDPDFIPPSDFKLTR